MINKQSKKSLIKKEHAQDTEDSPSEDCLKYMFARSLLLFHKTSF